MRPRDQIGNSRQVTMPDPIKVTFTAKELCALHLAAELVVNNIHEPFDQLVRAVAVVKDALEAKGCKLTDDGWVAT